MKSAHCTDVQGPPRLCCLDCAPEFIVPVKDKLRPVDKYAVRFLEESGPPFDVAAVAAAAAAAAGDGRADWDVEQIQALQEQVLVKGSFGRQSERPI